MFPEKSQIELISGLPQCTLLLMRGGDLFQCDRCFGALIGAQYQLLFLGQIQQFDIGNLPGIRCHLR
jgi:hypothetical protein